jgi:tetratricopeptide (TPR) repeat protein
MLSGYLRIGLGDVEQGYADLDRALSLAEMRGDPRARAQVLWRMAQADVARSLHDRARRHLVSAIGLTQEISDPLGEAVLQKELGTVYLSTGQTGQARSAWEQARSLYEQLVQPEQKAKIDRLLKGLTEGTNARR